MEFRSISGLIDSGRAVALAIGNEMIAETMAS